MGYILKNDQREILRRLVPKPESRFFGHIQSLFQIVSINKSTTVDTP